MSDCSQCIASLLEALLPLTSSFASSAALAGVATIAGACLNAIEEFCSRATESSRSQGDRLLEALVRKAILSS